VLGQRQSVDEYKRHLDAARPGAVGCLLKAIQIGLSNYESTPTPQGLRMADTAKFVTAAESAFGWESGAFVSAYKRNQMKVVMENVSENPVCKVLSLLLDDRGGRIVGTPTTVFNWLNAKADAIDLSIRNEPEWPKSASSLSKVLGRLEGMLSKLNIMFQSVHSQANERRFTITNTEVHPL
jgi:hypothetical protein